MLENPLGGLVLEQPTLIDGEIYPEGTEIIGRYIDLGKILENARDALFEDAGAKLCPLCHEPYEGDACPCVKDGQPGKE